MKDTFTNIDELILSKSFSELTPDELLSIKDIAKEETGYNQIQATLLAIKKELLTADDITPRESTKESLLAAFDKARPALNSTTTSRSMGLGYFFPKDKSVIKMPGIQILSVAASLLLIISLVDFGSSNFPSTDQALVTTNSKKTNTTKELPKDTSNNTTTKHQRKTSIDKESNEFEKGESLSSISKLTESKTSTKENLSSITEDIASEELAISTDQNLPEMEMNEEASEDQEISENNNGINQPTIPQTPNNQPNKTNNNSTPNNTPIFEKSSTPPTNDAFINSKKRNFLDNNSIMSSRTLAEDAKLIELFYTAM